jgi:hypothetical protein
MWATGRLYWSDQVATIVGKYYFDCQLPTSVISGSVYRRRDAEAVGDSRCGRAEHRDEKRRGVEPPLLRGAEHGPKDLLTAGPAGSAIAAATHFAGHDHWANRMFGAPVGGVEGGVKEETEDGLVLGAEMALKTRDREATAGRAGEQRPESCDVAATGDGEAMGRHGAEVIAVAGRQRVLQNRLHGRDEGLPRIIEQETATRAQQMRETGLMARVPEVPIRLPAVAHQDTGIVRAHHRSRLREAATGLNRIDRRIGSDKHPEPLQIRADAPTRLIRRHDRTAAHAGRQRVITRRRLPGGPVHRVNQAAPRHGHPAAVLQQLRDLAVGQPEPFIQQDGEGDRLRAQLHRRRAQGIRRLQRMAALDAPPALRTPPDVDVKLANERTLHRQLFLILRRHTLGAHPPLTVRTLRREWRDVRLIDVGRGGTMRAPAVGGTRLSTGRPWQRDAGVAGERRGLARDGAPGGLQFVVQFFVFATEALTLRFRPAEILAEVLDLAAQLLDRLFWITRRGVRWVSDRPCMPNSSPIEKHKELMVTI